MREESERRERERERERRRERREHRNGEKVEIPCFPKTPYWDLYVPWEKEVNKIYLCQRISDEELISLVILKFEGSVLTWWNKMERIWKHEKRPKIDTWKRMKYVLRERCEPFTGEWQFYDEVVKKDKERKWVIK